MARLLQTLKIGLLVAFMSATHSFADSQSSAPLEKQTGAQSTIDQQFQAFRDRDHEMAFQQAAPALRKIFGSTNRFIGMVKKGYGPIYDAKSWSFGRSKMNEDTLFQEVLIGGPDGRNWTALYQLQQLSNGEWKITSVRMVPSEGQST